MHMLLLSSNQTAQKELLDGRRSRAIWNCAYLSMLWRG